MNRFPEQVERYWRPQARCLVISAFPSDLKSCDFMRDSMEGSLRAAGLGLSVLDLWDDRTKDFSAEALHSYDVVFLGGGHVPTENAFFHRIGLLEKIRDFDGIIIGISAGTMNAADTVYAQPELAGEAVDPAYRKFLTGLGLTDINICPHYQMLKDSILDGMRLFDDITYADSRGRRFLALPDGSYVLIRDGKAEVWGEAWQIADGKLTAFCGRDESRSVPSSIY
jgi:peptidase E